MKKNKLIFVFTASLVLVLPCFAKSKKNSQTEEKLSISKSDDNKSEEKIEKTDEVVTESAETAKSNTEVNSEDNKTDEKAVDEENAEVNTGKKSNADESRRNYTGWIDTSGKDINLKQGSIYLKARPKLGTFNIQAITEDGKNIPLLQTSDEFTTTSFYIRYNKKIYKLSAENAVQTGGKRLKDGIELSYHIEDVADVVITFTCLESVPGSGYDMLKITSVVTNKGQKKAAISQKLILDTILGETDSSHFYTSENVPITNEAMFRTMQNEKWFVSKNKTTSLQLLLDGADISPIDAVALANYSTLSRNTWEPDMLSYRAFDTVTSYNNSAAGIFWPEKSVNVDGKTSVTFYIAVSTDNKAPQGYAYIEKKDSIKKKDIPEVVIPDVAAEKKETATDDVVIEIDNEKITDNTEKKTQAQPKETVVIDTPAKTSANVQFDVSTLSKEQLTPEYIQNLLDRILALEESDVALNRDELLQLNAELDAILESLR